MLPWVCRQGLIGLWLPVILVFYFPVVFFVEAVPATVPNPYAIPIETGGSLRNNKTKKGPAQERYDMSAEEKKWCVVLTKN